jgi:uncharacterized membrane protein YkoI
MKRAMVSLLSGVLISIYSTALIVHGMQGEPKEVRLTLAQLPPAVLEAIKTNCAGCSIDKATREVENGVTIYDIEFKGGKGEIAIAEDGSVIDREVVVKLKDVPAAALDAIRKNSAGGKIKQVARGEIRAELKDGQITKLASPRYVYEAELLKGEQVGEIEVTAEGQVLEPTEWRKRGKKEP